MSLYFFKRYFAKRYALLQALKAGALDGEQQQVNFGARFFAHLVTVLIVACFSPCFSCKSSRSLLQLTRVSFCS